MKYVLFLFLLFSSFGIFSAEDRPSKCAVFVLSDIHLVKEDKDREEKDKSLHYQIYKKGLENMRQKMEEAVAQKGADCVSLVVNGDPYNRSDDSKLNGSGFENNSDADKKALIEWVASDIKNKLFNNSLQSTDAPGIYNNQIANKNIKIFLASNMGDHEIPKFSSKLSSGESLDAHIKSFIEELPSSIKNTREGRALMSKNFETLEEFKLYLKNNLSISESSRGFYQWRNGDDYQKINSVGNKIMSYWGASGFFTKADDKINPDPDPADPRRGHLFQMPDGRSYIFAHVDKVTSVEEENNLMGIHQNQGHPVTFQATIYRGYPQGDIRNESMYHNTPIFTGDSHVPRFSLSLAVEDPIKEKWLSTLLHTTNLVNPGSFSSLTRQGNALNGYAIYLPEGDSGKSTIMGLSMKLGDASGYALSDKLIQKWMDQKTSQEQLVELKAQLSEAIKNGQFIPDNPNKVHTPEFFQSLVKAKDIQQLLKVLNDYNIVTYGTTLNKLINIIWCKAPITDNITDVNKSVD